MSTVSTRPPPMLPATLPELLEYSAPVRTLAPPHRRGVYLGAGVVAWASPCCLDLQAHLADLGLDLSERAGTWRAATWLVGTAASDARCRTFTAPERELLEQIRWGETISAEDIAELRALVLTFAHVAGLMRAGRVL